MLPVILTVAKSTFWLVILVVALITLIIGTLAGAFAAYKVLPNNAKKQADAHRRNSVLDYDGAYLSSMLVPRGCVILGKVAHLTTTRNSKCVARKAPLNALPRTFSCKNTHR